MVGFMASMEMSYENVDGRTTDGWLYYKLAFGSGELKCCNVHNDQFTLNQYICNL